MIFMHISEYYEIITVKPLVKDTLKEDKPPNKGQAESTRVYKLYRKLPLKEDNLSTKDKTAGPEGVLIKNFHCTWKHRLIFDGKFIAKKTMRFSWPLSLNCNISLLFFSC